MERRERRQRASLHLATLVLSAQLGVACGADREGELSAGVGGAGGSAAPMAGAGAGIGAGGMTQVAAGSGGFAGVAAGSAGASGIGGAGGIAGDAAGGIGGMGGASGGDGGAGGMLTGGSGGSDDAGMMGEPDAGPDAGPTSDGCAALPLDATPPYTPVYRVPLRVHTTRSDLDRETLCGVLGEVNEIWWTQAGVCFEIEIVGDDAIADTGMDLWFERSAPFPNGTNANGVYAGQHEIYSLDEPNLNAAPNPTEYLPARTAAHELGHGLNLDHQNCGTACNDLLMTSGRRGFALVTGSPASVDEHARARDRASDLALSDTAPTVCGAAIFLDDSP